MNPKFGELQKLDPTVTWSDPVFTKVPQLPSVKFLLGIVTPKNIHQRFQFSIQLLLYYYQVSHNSDID